MAAIKYKCAHQGDVIIQLCRDCRKEDVGDMLPRAKVVAVLRRLQCNTAADIFEAGKEDE